MLLSLLALVRAVVQLAEAEVAVGDEGAHATRLGERQRLAVMGLAALGVELVGMGGDIAEQVQRMSREPGLARRNRSSDIAGVSVPGKPRWPQPASRASGSMICVTRSRPGSCSAAGR